MDNQREKNLIFKSDVRGNLDGDDRERLEAELVSWQEAKIDGEVEKPQELAVFLEMMIPKVVQVVEGYGATPMPLTAEMVHLMPEDKYREYVRHLMGNDACIKEDAIGISLLSRGILLNAGHLKEWDIDAFCNVIHELFHNVSVRKIAITEEPGKDVPNFEYRIGLRVKRGSHFNIHDSYFHLGGLNEAITQFLMVRFYEKEMRKDPQFKELVEKKDAILSAEQREHGYFVVPGGRGYVAIEKLFEDLVKKIYEDNEEFYESIDDLRDRIIRSYFTDSSPARLFVVGGQNCFLDLTKIKPDNSPAVMEAIRNFRKKYGLPEDKQIEK